MDDRDEEIQELQAQLREAREALRAVWSGEVDAVLSSESSDSLTREPFTRASSERIYRLIIERMREGAVTVPRGVDAVVYCNRSFAEMIDLPPERVVGGSLARWLEVDEGPPIDDLLGGHEPMRGDYRLRSTAGRQLPVSVSATLVLEQGQEIRCLIVNDLRVRRDVERLQQVRAELELANQRKNEFIAMLGHELRNPLAPVRQAVELLQDHSRPQDPEHLRRARDVIARQIVHLTRLVDDLLDVGRITKGTLGLHPGRVDLCEVIRTALESVDRLLHRRGHRLHIELPPRPMWVDGDVVRLTQVFTNILSNAAKYTPDRGRVEIRACREGLGHRVVIRDNGRGIDPELLPYLFEPFVQSEATLHRAAGGIGVGLTLVRRIVELHGGQASAHSDGVGQGSEIRVWLPEASDTSDADPPPGGSGDDEEDQAPPPAGSRRILVVDDNEDAAEMLALILRKRGHRVSLAFDGEEALDAAASRQPEVVLLDIGLPGIDGYEVARRLRDTQGDDELLLVALTGYGQPEDRAQAIDAGFDHHLIKPISIETLVPIIGETVHDE